VYALTTFLPFVVLAVTTYVAGFGNVQTYIRKSQGFPDAFSINALLSVAMLVLSTIICIVSIRDWVTMQWSERVPVEDSSAA